ncbi:hypothetical protein FF1_003629 [Malus domestica]
MRQDESEASGSDGGEAIRSDESEASGSVAVYSFEGVGMVLPLESEAKDKDKFGKVLAWTMTFISLMYGSFGALGYFAFGDQTKDMITANYGAGLISTLVKLGLVVNLFFTLPIMMNPVYEIVERRFWGGRYCLWMRWVLGQWCSDVSILVLGVVLAVSGTWSALQEMIAAKVYEENENVAAGILKVIGDEAWSDFTKFEVEKAEWWERGARPH